MAKKSTQQQTQKMTALPFKDSSWLSEAKLEKNFQFKSRKNTAYIYLATNSKKSTTLQKELLEQLLPWQQELFKKSEEECVLLQTEYGYFWRVDTSKPKSQMAHHGLLNKSIYAHARDLVGSLIPKIKDLKVEQLVLILDDSDDTISLGALVGCELGFYSYKTKITDLKLTITNCDSSIIEKASAIGYGTNFARHLVNMPANDLNPKSYAELIEERFHAHPSMTVEIWNEDKLKKEGMGLLVGVGQAGEEKSRLVKISYRPKGKNKLDRPLAFVGKGITFDTGGLDIKPSASMRLMKKDMGGSATLVGFAQYLAHSKINVSCDIYLALAENAVSEKAIRPGDVLTAMNGKTVEIHNTDAEGRLVMADALHLATTQKGKEEPLAIFDTSTLTGAMRTALGTTIAGMCANDDVLAEAVLKSGSAMGDLCWRMPLFDGYKSQLNSYFADMSNCSSGPFGGGLTAALFLQEFVNNKKWVHFDFMSWVDGATGALTEQGGNGQMVQMFADLLDQVEMKMF